MSAPVQPPLIVVPGHALVVLIGAPGSGKSTLARRAFRLTEILSSDGFRAMVADDEADQGATPAAFDLLHRAARHRLRRARLTVIDATNLKRTDRRPLVALAQELGRPAVAIVFVVPDVVAQDWNRARPGRRVDATVVATAVRTAAEIGAAPERLLAEGFRAVHVVRGADAVNGARVVREGRPARGRLRGTAEPGAATNATPPEFRSGGPPGRTS